MKPSLAILSLLALSACSSGHDAGDTASAAAEAVGDELAEAGAHFSNFGDGAKQGFYGGLDRMADWMRPVPKPGPPQPIAASYCYTVLQDIMCYRKPMPGWEHRLVAYQGTNAPAPPPALMEPLPKRQDEIVLAKVEEKPADKKPEETKDSEKKEPEKKEAPKKTDVKKDEGAKRAEAAKPVFDEIPNAAEHEAPKDENSATPTIVDPTHEQLPDPSLAPQL